MHNYHSVEVEAEFRRLEWERAAAADTRAAMAVGGSIRPARLKLPRFSLPSLARSVTPRLAFTSMQPTRPAAESSR